MDHINRKYYTLCARNCDINEHLPTLYLFAKDCESVFETGVRGCISSWALVKGLLENNKPIKSLFMNDIDPCNISELLNTVNGLPISVKYEWVNNLQLELPGNVDLTFIDTWHIYGHLKRELEKFSKVTNKYIVMHDTTVDAVHGESVRCGFNIVKQSIDSGYPVEEISCGLQRAIDEFLSAHPEWKLHVRYVNNNGLTILKRV